VERKGNPQNVKEGRENSHTGVTDTIKNEGLVTSKKTGSPTENEKGPTILELGKKRSRGGKREDQWTSEEGKEKQASKLGFKFQSGERNALIGRKGSKGGEKIEVRQGNKKVILTRRKSKGRQLTNSLEREIEREFSGGEATL